MKLRLIGMLRNIIINCLYKTKREILRPFKRLYKKINKKSKETTQKKFCKDEHLNEMGLIGIKEQELLWDSNEKDIQRLAQFFGLENIRSLPDGICLNSIRSPVGGLLKINIEASPQVKIDVRCVGNGQPQYGITRQITNGELSFLVYIPREEEFAIEMRCRQAGDVRWFINSIRIESINSEEYYEETKQNRNYEVVASLASIPKRINMLKDCVESLLFQVDKLYVFLNNYSDVPDFLIHNRIEIERSDDWSDRGDLGKFFWIDRLGTAGYRIIVDDDLIFPPDFVEVMVSKVASYENRIIAGAHGIVLRQPINKFHETASRAYTAHFTYRNNERPVHILGTGALCFHSSTVNMKWSDFLFRNSADIWLAIYGQRQKIPLICIEHQDYWITENKHDGATETIFQNSLNNAASSFNSSLIQNATLKTEFPLTVNSISRIKVAFIWTGKDVTEFKKLITTLLGLELQKDLLISAIIIDNDNHFYEATDGITIPFETFVLNNKNRITFFNKTRYDVYFVCDHATNIFPIDDREILLKSFHSKYGTGSYLSSINSSENKVNFIMYRGIYKHDNNRDMLEDAIKLVGNTQKISSTHKLLTTDDLIKKLQIDCSICSDSTFYEIENDYSKRVFNRTFDRIVFLNLNDRADKKQRIEAELKAHGIDADRFEGFNDQDSSNDVEYETYLTRDLVSSPKNVDSVQDELDFYIRSKSDAARIAWLEQNTQHKAIRSKGAWAYLKRWEKILEQAVTDGVETLLVFDDDVLLHKNAKELLETALEGLPQDWLVLQLGTFQNDWNNPWVEWLTPYLYRTNGHCVGSYAVALRFEAMVYMLDYIKQMSLPFDAGALSAVARDFPDRCFVTYPNIAIQTLENTVIETSSFQTDKNRKLLYGHYRWNIEDYGIVNWSAPDYVQYVFRKSLNLKLNKLKETTVKSTEEAPILICVLKDESIMIDEFMRHYRELGVLEFIFIDNGSQDGTVEYLTDCQDVTLYQTLDKFIWTDKQAWINYAINQRGLNRWYLYVDADELLVYDNCEHHKLCDLTRFLDEKGITRCRGMLIDMYAQDEILKARYESGKLYESYPYYDANGYNDQRFSVFLSRKGGPRKRALCQGSNINPELTKYPLFRLSDGEVFANPHHIWPHEKNFISPCYLGLLHFKFLPGLMAHLEKAVEDGIYWDNSSEYSAYLKALKENPHLSLIFENSQRYTSSQDLIKNRLLSPIWNV